MIKEFVERLSHKNPAVADLVKKTFGCKPLANSGIYRALVLQKARSFARRFAPPSPIVGVNIETTLSCNSRCVMCLHGYRKMAGLMSRELFRKIVDECAQHKVADVILCGYGEPLVDPHFLERIDYLRQRGCAYGLVTNGYLLTDELSRKLLELGGLNRINFSVNGFSKEVYEKVMAGLKRDTTYANILNFLQRKAELKRDDVTVTISCVKTKLNKAELGDFCRFWKKQKGVDRIITGDLWDRYGDASPEQEIGEPGPLHRKDRWLTPCKELWGSCTIYHDGRVAPCCVDNDLRELIVGDVTTESLADIFQGERLAALRRLHLEDRRPAQPICGQCPFHSVWF